MRQKKKNSGNHRCLQGFLFCAVHQCKIIFGIHQFCPLLFIQKYKCKLEQLFAQLRKGKYNLAAGNSAWARLVGTTHPENEAALPLRSVKPWRCSLDLGWCELIICAELKGVIN